MASLLNPLGLNPLGHRKHAGNVSKAQRTTHLSPGVFAAKRAAISTGPAGAIAALPKPPVQAPALGVRARTAGTPVKGAPMSRRRAY